MSTSEPPAVKSAVNTTPPSPLHQFSKENVFHLPIWASKLTTEEVLDQHSDDNTLVHDAHDRLDCGDPRLRQFNRIKMWLGPSWLLSYARYVVAGGRAGSARGAM